MRVCIYTLAKTAFFDLFAKSIVFVFTESFSRDQMEQSDEEGWWKDPDLSAVVFLTRTVLSSFPSQPARKKRLVSSQEKTLGRR